MLNAAQFGSIGLFGRLQQVMQNEKERDLDFRKKLQAEGLQLGKGHVYIFFFCSYMKFGFSWVAANSWACMHIQTTLEINMHKFTAFFHMYFYLSSTIIFMNL